MANGKPGRPRKHPKKEPFPFEVPDWLKKHPDYEAELAAWKKFADNLLNEQRRLALQGVGPEIWEMWDETDPELTDTPLSPEEAAIKYAKALAAADEKSERLSQNQLRGAHTAKTPKDEWQDVDGVKEIIEKVRMGNMTIRRGAGLIDNKLNQAGVKLGQESLRKKLSQIKKNG